MLSVQTAGCAGMERLGVPTRTTLNTPPDDRDQYICRMHIDAARELLGVRNEPMIRGSNSSSSSHHQPQHHNHTDHTHHHQQQHHLNNHRRTVTSASNSSSISPASPNATTAISSGNHSISNGNNNTNNVNNNSNNCNNNLSPMTNNTTEGSSGIIKRDALEASTAVKYNMLSCGSGSGSSGGGSSNGSCCISVSGSQCSLSSHSNDHHQHYQHQLQQQKTLCCPHHVPLPDSEWIPADQRPAQLRSSYQHSELTRSYIKPPPNKTVKDVPDRSSYNFSSSSTHSSNSGLHSLASSQSLPISYSPSMASTGISSAFGSSSGSGSSNSVAQPKSKPNVITKFFYRKCSPKSPNNVASSASSSSSAFPSSSGSTQYTTLSSSSSIASSASSLLSSASAGSTSSTVSLNSQASVQPALVMAPLPTLSISTAASLKTTPCDFGPAAMQHNSGTCINNISAGLVPSTQLLTTIGVSHPTATTTFPQTAMPTTTMERIPTPPLSVSVPINAAYQQHKQQQQQHLLLDCLVGDSASVYSTLQTIKSSSCSPTLSANTTCAAAVNNAGVKDDFAYMECQSGNITRNNSSSSMNSLTTAPCNCQNTHCRNCNSDATTTTTTPTSSSS